MFAWSADEHSAVIETYIMDSTYVYSDSLAHLTAIRGLVFRGFSTNHMGKGNMAVVEKWFSLKDI